MVQTDDVYAANTLALRNLLLTKFDDSYLFSWTKI
jgi:hypothetical protein